MADLTRMQFSRGGCISCFDSISCFDVYFEPCVSKEKMTLWINADDFISFSYSEQIRVILLSVMLQLVLS